MTFPPERAAALAHLRDFLPHAGSDYARLRNYDLPEQNHPHVSRLSPYLRHRVITELEVVEATLARFSLKTSEKFIQEVFWRTYWKGWLEMRPSVWADYRRALDGQLAAINDQTAASLARAENGETGIAPFDAWMLELRETGYLHNHARMWFASIWIFTLRLPWEIGADLFLRYLIDGDPASNTLGWRWVAGLQTKGKHYLARPSNIETYTKGRFNPAGQLTTDAAPLSGPNAPARSPLPETTPPGSTLKTAILLTEEDLSPSFLLDSVPSPMAHAALLSDQGRSPRAVAAHVTQFSTQAAQDTLQRWGARMGQDGPLSRSLNEIADWARSSGAEQIVTAYAPVGPAASALRKLAKLLQDDGIALHHIRRDWDSAAWPHATHGFFRFKEAIPDLVARL